MMTEKEARTRKWWLASLVISMASNVAYLTYQTFKNPEFFKVPGWGPKVILGFNGAWVIALGYILYRCIYQKPGARVLTFFLVFIPITTALTWVGYISGTVPTPTNIWMWSYTILSNGFGVWWYIVNWKMRKINQKIKQLLTM